MEHLHNGYKIDFSKGAFPLSTDSIALAHFAAHQRMENCLDLGSGCGTLGILLCARCENCAVTGIEIDENAHKMALENAQRNLLSSRLTSICADMNNIRDFIPAGSFSCCVSNPPYFTGGPDGNLPNARRQDLCSTQQLFQAAAWALKFGGDFYLVHRPEKLAEIFHIAVQQHLQPKRLRLLRHRQDGPVTLVLIHCKKGGKPDLKWEEVSLYTQRNEPTDYYRALYL